MWTPKRIVLLALGFCVFFAGYLLYSTCLGGVDGLPPLPDIDMPDPAGSAALGPMPPRFLKLDDKLCQAFGPQCPELGWHLQLEMNAKNMVVASKDFAIDDDGRVNLDHISVAMFGKDQHDGKEVEINTIRAKKAYLTFDKKLGKSEKEFSARRIVAAELIDEIEIVNNHGTSNRGDDLHVNIEKGPLYYDEAKHLIWTDDAVHVEDDKDQPPTDVRGQGMEVRLTPAETQAAPRPGTPAPPRKTKSDSFSGVDSIVLRSNVVMHLYSTGGFLTHPSESNAKAAGPDKAPAAPPAKADVSIFTPGPFRYDFHKDGDVARFDVLEPDPARPQKSEPVKVIRHSTAPDGKNLFDSLICQHLELKLTRKEAAAGRDDKGADHGLQVETAHAVALGDDEVEVKSDAEKLVAHGHDFLYNAATRLTVLKGDPNRVDSGMSADSDGGLIHAREMQIQEQPGPAGKNWRQIIAKGPGRLDFQDKKPDAARKPDPNKKPEPAKKPTHAFWNDKLTSTKDGPLDLIILTGAAKFIDDENDQSLQGETLKVWLTSPEGGPPAAQPAPQRDVRRPSHVEATGNVSAKSKEMTIPHAGQLVIWFRDVPAGAMLPAMGPAAPAQANPAPANGAAVAVAPPAAPASAPAPKAGAASPANTEPEPVRPIDLTARSVYVWVARSEDKTGLEKLDAEGDVAVRQDPAKPGEKPLDVKGASLELTYHPEGDFLVVRGDLAQLQMETIYIMGPEVTIDQASNKAWVVGSGAMQLESQTNFQGDKLAKPVPMTIYWNDNMFFNGRYAEFSKGVHAEQENAHLACQSLQVFFDRPMSLKEGNHGGPPPRVKNLVCYKDVRVDDRTLEGDKVVSSKRLTGPALNMNALEAEDGDVKAPSGSTGNEIRMPGPGDVRLFQIGGADPLAAPADPNAKVAASKPAPTVKPGAAKKSDDQMKLTYISYGGVTGGSMYANSKTNTATFLENVRVLNMPCNNPNIEINLDLMLDNLPEGALYLRGDRLDVYNHGDKAKPQQEMTAKGHVLVQAKDFYSRSDVMRYNEAKDQIIFEGGDGGYATLYKIKQRGAAPQKLEGQKIIYIRSTGRYQVDGGDWISGEN